MSIDSEINGSGRIPTILLPILCAGFGNTEAQRTRRRNPLLLYLNSLFDPFSVSLCLCVSKKELRTAHPSSAGFGNTEAQRTPRRNPLLLYLKSLFDPFSVSLCFKKEFRTAHPSSAGFGNTEAQRTPRRSPLLLYLKSLSILSLCLCVSYPLIAVDYPSNTIDEFGFVEID